MESTYLWPRGSIDEGGGYYLYTHLGMAGVSCGDSCVYFVVAAVYLLMEYLLTNLPDC